MAAKDTIIHHLLGCLSFNKGSNEIIYNINPYDKPQQYWMCHISENFTQYTLDFVTILSKKIPKMLKRNIQQFDGISKK